MVTVTLATNNTITAANLNISDQNGTGGGGEAILYLGQTNIFNIGTINMGTGGRASSTLGFATGLTGPTVKIRNTDGISAVTAWNLGAISDNSANGPWNSLADLSAGAVDATIAATEPSPMAPEAALSTLPLPLERRPGQNFNVGNLNVGVYTNGVTAMAQNMTANGTFTMNNAAGIVNATNITLDINTGVETGGYTKTVTGTFNLTNGTLNATTVQRGAQTGNATTSTLAFNWTAGTIGNLSGGNLAFDRLPIDAESDRRPISTCSTSPARRYRYMLDANSPSAGPSALRRPTAARWCSTRQYSYTGATAVNGGSLLLGAGGAIGASATTVAANATLGSATTNTTTIGAATTYQPGGAGLPSPP